MRQGQRRRDRARCAAAAVGDHSHTGTVRNAPVPLTLLTRRPPDKACDENPLAGLRARKLRRRRSCAGRSCRRRRRWGSGSSAGPRSRPGEALLLVPVGSVEQHGPHLPLATDTMIANAVTRAAAERLDATGARVLVAPSLNYGASGEHEGFPGTVSIGHEALLLLLAEFGRSACRWASGVVFVNGHGGNAATLTKAVELLRYEGRAVAWTSTALPDADAHAGETETSLLRFLAPWVGPGRPDGGRARPSRSPS